jgi:hypothetical protein
LSDVFCIQNGIIIIINNNNNNNSNSSSNNNNKDSIALEYSRGRVKEVEGEFELNCTHRILTNVDGVNLFSKRKSSIKKRNIELCWKAGVVANIEKTEYRSVFMSLHQIAGQYRNINVSNKCFNNVTKLKYLELIVTNQNCIHEEIKSI